jgi:hypothetical protein
MGKSIVAAKSHLETRLLQLLTNFRGREAMARVVIKGIARLKCRTPSKPAYGRGNSMDSLIESLRRRIAQGCI